MLNCLVNTLCKNINCFGLWIFIFWKKIDCGNIGRTYIFFLRLFLLFFGLFGTINAELTITSQEGFPSRTVNISNQYILANTFQRSWQLPNILWLALWSATLIKFLQFPQSPLVIAMQAIMCVVVDKPCMVWRAI